MSVERTEKPLACDKAGFFGSDSAAQNIVYVIDRSGSMLDTFDYVRRELAKSITALNAEQDFHVIFFAAGAPIENPPKKFVSATDDKKKEAVSFLSTVRPEGQSNPLPALTRAFDLLDKAAPAKKGKLTF